MRWRSSCRRASRRSCRASSSPSPSGSPRACSEPSRVRCPRSTRRVLHRLNLPAGTDVSRILNEIGQLRVQVRELSAELDEARDRAGRPAAGAGRRRSASGRRRRSGRPSGRAPPDGHRPHTRRGRRARAPRRRAQRAARAQRAQAPRRRRATAADADAEGDDLVGREGRAVALPERPCALPDAAAVRAQPRVAQLRVRPRARQQLHRDDARPRLRHLPRRLGRARRAGERQHAGDVHRRLHPAGRRRGPAALRRAGRQPVRVLLRRGAVAAVGGREHGRCRSAAWPSWRRRSTRATWAR